MLPLINDIILIALSVLLGYFACKSQVDTKEIQKKLKRLKKTRGEVIKPKTAEEIRKEREKKFYQSIQ